MPGTVREPADTHRACPTWHRVGNDIGGDANGQVVEAGSVARRRNHPADAAPHHANRIQLKPS